MAFCSSPISSTKRHSVMLLAMKNDQKSTLSFKSEARGHEKGQLRPKSQLATASSIFFPYENRHWVEAIPKIWWLKKVAIALFQNWPKSLHKFQFFTTLRVIFSSFKMSLAKTMICPLQCTVCWAIMANKLKFWPQHPSRFSTVQCATLVMTF